MSTIQQSSSVLVSVITVFVESHKQLENFFLMLESATAQTVKPTVCCINLYIENDLKQQKGLDNKAILEIFSKSSLAARPKWTYICNHSRPKSKYDLYFTILSKIKNWVLIQIPS